MLKKSIISISVHVLAFCVLSTISVGAVEEKKDTGVNYFKIGLIALYDWWKPAYMNLVSTREMQVFTPKPRITNKEDGSYMLGLILGGRRGAFHADMVLRSGLTPNVINYRTLYGYELYTSPSLMLNQNYIDSGQLQVRRFGGDLDMGVQVWKYLDVLFGLRADYHYFEKSEGMQYVTSTIPFIPSGFVFRKDVMSAWYAGPFMGLGAHVEPVENLVLRLDLSAVVQGGMLEMKRKKYLLLTLPYTYSVRYLAYGPDARAKITYIAAKRLELSVGGRYACLYHHGLGDRIRSSSYSSISYLKPTYRRKWITGEVDRFWAVTVEAALRI